MSARPEDTGHQPWLHDLEIAAHGNLTCVGDRSGDLDSPGTGLYVDDRRVLTRWALTADDERPVRVAAHSSGATTRVLAVARNLGDEGPDPTIEVHRRRLLVDDGLREEVAVVSRWDQPLRCRLRLEAAGRRRRADASSRPAAAPRPPGRDRRRRLPRLARRAPRDARAAGGCPGRVGDGRRRRPRLGGRRPGRRPPRLDRRRRRASYLGHLLRPHPGGHLVDWGGVRVTATDRRLDLVVDRSVADLTGWCSPTPTPPATPSRRPARRGTSRCSVATPLWAARLTLPFGTDLAAGTLRTLARRQGTDRRPEHRGAARQDPARGAQRAHRRPGRLPPATALLRHRRRHAAVDPAAARRVALGARRATSCSELRPHLDAALGWVRRAAADSPDGFLRYVDATGTGLANQGWKDSEDAMRRRDGTIAPPPIALVETQAYAVAAPGGRGPAGGGLRGGRRGPAHVGRRPRGAGAATLLGRGRRRPLPRDGPRPRRHPGRRRRQQHGPRPRHRHAERGGERARGRPADRPGPARGRTASGPSAAPTRRTTRSATTPARCGPTTPRSPRSAWSGTGTPARRPRVLRALVDAADPLRLPLPRAVRGQPRVPDCRSPTRRPAGPRPGRPPRPGHWSPRPSAWPPTRPPGGCRWPDATRAVRGPAGPRAARARRARRGRRGRRRQVSDVRAPAWLEVNVS